MKFEKWYLAETYGFNYESEKYPILDWTGYYISKHIDYSSLGPGLRHGFTGKHYKVLSFTLYLFRRQFGVYIEWAHGKMSPEQAKIEHHQKRKKKK